MTSAVIDEPIRHITKMATYHFTAAEEYKRSQLGEENERIFCVGGLGVEAVARTQYLKRIN